jgi:dihydropteroate synthase
LFRRVNLASFSFKNRFLSLDQAHVMGILNVTPDSFSDGGRFANIEQALVQAQQMIASGAAIIDIGGESTRPGAKLVSEQQELDRVIPVIERLVKECDTVISVDTSTAAVMKEAARAGAHLINDVRALTRPNAMFAAVESGLPVCLMHSQGEPGTMQDDPQYADVVAEVSVYLAQRVDACVSAGITREQIIVDPGFGFGKTLEHNLLLMKNLQDLQSLDLPSLVGVSRKSMVGGILNKNVEDRLIGSLALAAKAICAGAWLIRAHDVDETVQLVTTLNAVHSCRY